MGRKRKRFDGPSPFGDTSKHFVPMPYDGRLPNGKKTWIPAGYIRFAVGADEHYVEPGALAMFLVQLGIHEGEPSDWIQDEKVVAWVKANGIVKWRNPELK